MTKTFLLLLLSPALALSGHAGAFLSRAFVPAEEPAADEAAFASRYGAVEGCDLTALAHRAERTLSLPVQRLKTGAGRVSFRYIETGWPLGFPALDGQRPARLGPKAEDWFKNLPSPGRGTRSTGVLRLGPAGVAGNRFAVVLDGDSRAWKDARLWIARKGDGDFRGAVPLKLAGSPKSSVFSTLAVLHLAYSGGGTHPLVLWLFTDPKGENLRYYALAHWRAEVELPSGVKAVMVLYDFKGTGDYSMNPLALSDGSRSGGGADIREPDGDIDWKPRSLLGAGRAVRLPKEVLRLKAVSPKGDWAEVEIEPR